MDVKLHRGKNQIGGNIVEISTGKTKIILVVGCELDEDFPKPPKIDSLFKFAGYDAVFVSHYHLDHMGLAGSIHSDIPVYIGFNAYAVVAASMRYKNEAIPNFKLFHPDAGICIGNMKITPYLVDHSAFDAYMFLVEADGEKVLYTGDFRANGRKSFDKLLSMLPSEIDILICEGTTLSRSKKCNLSEYGLERKATTLFRQKSGPIFILQSAMNIDRIVTMYRAAKKSGRLFLQDLYMAEITSAAGDKIPNPRSFRDVKVFITRPYSNEHFRYVAFSMYGQKRVGKKQITKEHFVMCVRASMGSYIKSLAKTMDFSDGLLIYSMWEGYRSKPEMQQFLNLCKNMGLDIFTLHTSGHADELTITKLIKRTNPAKIIPIHTENATWFKNHFDEIEIIL